MRIRPGDIAGPWEASARVVGGILTDIRNVLNGGLRVADQAQVRTFVWNSAKPAPRVEVRGGKVPVGLLVLAASKPNSPGFIVSGVHIAWSWDGNACLVTSVGTTQTGGGPITPLAFGADYNVTILVLEA